MKKISNYFLIFFATVTMFEELSYTKYQIISLFAFFYLNKKKGIEITKIFDFRYFVDLNYFVKTRIQNELDKSDFFSEDND